MCKAIPVHPEFGHTLLFVQHSTNSKVTAFLSSAMMAGHKKWTFGFRLVLLFGMPKTQWYSFWSICLAALDTENFYFKTSPSYFQQVEEPILPFLPTNTPLAPCENFCTIILVCLQNTGFRPTGCGLFSRNVQFSISLQMIESNTGETCLMVRSQLSRSHFQRRY